MRDSSLVVAVMVWASGGGLSRYFALQAAEQRREYLRAHRAVVVSSQDEPLGNLSEPERRKLTLISLRKWVRAREGNATKRWEVSPMPTHGLIALIKAITKRRG